LSVEKNCARCRGTGRIITDACRECRGNGLVVRADSVTVTIPAGVDAGYSQLVSGAGSFVRAGRPAGDLEVVVEIEPHPFFRREGENVICKVPISFPQAALGAEVDVPTLEGRAKVKVAPGTASGSVLRLRGKGIPSRATFGRGDQLVEVYVEIPTSLTERQK